MGESLSKNHSSQVYNLKHSSSSLGVVVHKPHHYAKRVNDHQPSQPQQQHQQQRTRKGSNSSNGSSSYSSSFTESSSESNEATSPTSPRSSNNHNGQSNSGSRKLKLFASHSSMSSNSSPSSNSSSQETILFVGCEELKSKFFSHYKKNILTRTSSAMMQKISKGNKQHQLATLGNDVLQNCVVYNHMKFKLKLVNVGGIEDDENSLLERTGLMNQLPSHERIPSNCSPLFQNYVNLHPSFVVLCLPNEYFQDYCEDVKSTVRQYHASVQYLSQLMCELLIFGNIPVLCVAQNSHTNFSFIVKYMISTFGNYRGFEQIQKDNSQHYIDVIEKVIPNILMNVRSEKGCDKITFDSIKPYIKQSNTQIDGLTLRFLEPFNLTNDLDFWHSLRQNNHIKFIDFSTYWPCFRDSQIYYGNQSNSNPMIDYFKEDQYHYQLFVLFNHPTLRKVYIHWSKSEKIAACMPRYVSSQFDFNPKFDLHYFKYFLNGFVQFRYLVKNFAIYIKVQEIELKQLKLIIEWIFKYVKSGMLSSKATLTIEIGSILSSSKQPLTNLALKLYFYKVFQLMRSMRHRIHFDYAEGKKVFHHWIDHRELYPSSMNDIVQFFNYISLNGYSQQLCSLMVSTLMGYDENESLLHCKTVQRYNLEKVQFMFHENVAKKKKDLERMFKNALHRLLWESFEEIESESNMILSDINCVTLL
ncbi:hypothetical protein C9374_007322 [Naegleria lovaniensis]|uniref:Uncharacterized protein n=1 Tax=Naegleria lovaniensis TaxID=51637 RepID=A0AA88KIS1_NAELO|nr:uncharacterized protein C9374_007322 [Naegleria lovaniensis]KAG2379183.1 hypothetical protein C9374_007322 [Naegleria lovaniensis]